MTEQGTSNGSFIEKYMTPIAVLLGAIIIAGAFAFGRPDANQEAQPGAPVAVDIKDVKTEGSPFIGNPSAPVTMAVWFDYQCPFCKQFELTTVSQLYSEYVETGKLRIVFKDFQFLGPDSETAALFARAMWEAYPDRWYDWYRAMTEAQDEEHGGFGDLASIKTLTEGLGGIDVARVEALMNQKEAEYRAAIEADRAEGSALGIQGTPGAIIGTDLIAGAYPYDTVKPLIEAQLAQ
ncbi:MAG TPA: thioredoxin domain-containing protein [Candidatus Paceibacterota bacterium]|nr:thioredoxin domain-containing protein [Candidatus Paceibacterota bacterium]